MKPGNHHIFSKEGKTAVNIKTNVKASIWNQQHNQTAARASKVKTDLKAGVVGDPNGGYLSQQNNRIVARGLKVKTGIKAGPPDTPIVRG